MYGYVPSNKFTEYKRKYLSKIKFHYDLSKVTSNQDLIEGSIADDGKQMKFAPNGV